MADENYQENIAKQQTLVNRLAEDYKKAPSAELELKLIRETDLLRQLTNSALGKPKERSKETADVARMVALSRAVQPVGK